MSSLFYKSIAVRCAGIEAIAIIWFDLNIEVRRTANTRIPLFVLYLLNLCINNFNENLLNKLVSF